MVSRRARRLVWNFRSSVVVSVLPPPTVWYSTVNWIRYDTPLMSIGRDICAMLAFLRLSVCRWRWRQTGQGRTRLSGSGAPLTLSRPPGQHTYTVTWYSAPRPLHVSNAAKTLVTAYATLLLKPISLGSLHCSVAGAVCIDTTRLSVIESGTAAKCA